MPVNLHLLSEPKENVSQGKDRNTSKPWLIAL